jgi:glycosyltransferase involved in cell wall biosynthesis
MRQLTIIIPSYNHEQYIVDCLTTVSNISLDKIVYIIDDGSTDNTVSVARKFIHENSLGGVFKIIEKKNGGLNSSLQIAVTLLNTEYCYFTASDDMVKPDNFVKLFLELVNIKDADFIIGGADNFNEFGEKSFVYSKFHKRFFELNNGMLFKEIFFDYPHPILIQSTIFKSALIHRIGGWDREVRLDDYALWIKIFIDLINSNKKVLFKPTINIADYRHHSSNSYKNTIRQFELVAETLCFYCPKRYINSAIANALAYYTLSCIKKANLRHFFKLLIRLRFKFFLYFIYHLFRLPIKRLRN